jgi:hypothetical protein
MNGYKLMPSSHRCGLRKNRARKTRSIELLVDNGKTSSLPERNAPESEPFSQPAVRQAGKRGRSAVGGRHHETSPSDIDAVCALSCRIYASSIIPQ